MLRIALFAVCGVSLALSGLACPSPGDDGPGYDAALDPGGPTPDAADEPPLTTDDGAVDAGSDAIPDVPGDGGIPDPGGFVDIPVADPGSEVEPGEDIPEADVQVLFAHCSEPGGDRNIYDIQDPQCPDHFQDPPEYPDPGTFVEVKGVIVTAVFGDTFFIQEAQSGPYSGIAVYTGGTQTGLAPGDVVDVSGKYSEFYEASQLSLDEWTVTGTAQVPPPYVPSHPSHLSTNGTIGELFEGVLVEVQDVYTTHTQPDCPQDYGEWEVTGGLRIDDMGVEWEARLGDHFESITGPLHYTWGNYKIEPRSDDDIVWTVKGNQTAISKCLASECAVPASMQGTHAVVVNEFMPDPYGEDHAQEWIELHNPGATAVDIQNWEVRDCGDQKMTLTGPDLTIPAGGYLVIGANGNPATNGGVTVTVAYGTAYYLPNTVGSILLYDGAGPTATLIDQVRYSRWDPWTFETGASQARSTPLSDGAQASSWELGTATYGPTDNKGTPGEPN